ncbi:MAG: hypothetical protein K8S24_06320 [Candidatus Aegiribacteria sp.]|nr:hypothetical protein [Candidatus Aegiribacteria sp.]
MAIRSLAVLALIGVLWLLGIIDPGALPLHSREFQLSGVTVMLYLFWSAAESKYRGGSSSLPYTVFYAVLLVSAVDSFLLGLTVYGPPWVLRWAGVVLFASGSIVRLAAYRIRSVRHLRWGRYLQLAGLPVALGSIAGTVVAIAAGIPGSINEEINKPDDEEGSP